jgi:membrane-bound metal-dependent hydrolase YbcI (DUF457 family)
MWILGHVALGYFAGVIVSRFTKEKIFIPLIWFVSLLPDLDVFFYRYIIHRGPTHSIFFAFALFIPIYLITKRGLPYFAALLSHSMIGDYFEISSMLFWPFSDMWVGAPSFLQLSESMEARVGVFLFVLMIIYMTIDLWLNRKEQNVLLRVIYTG